MLTSPSSTTLPGPPAFFAWRAALLFCAPMMVNGIGLLYFPAMLQDLGMSDVEIGLIVSIPFLVRMIGMPVGAFLADRVSDRAIILVWSSAVSLATAVVMLFAQSFWPIALFYGLQGLFYAPFVPISEAILVSGVRRWGFDYGFLRMWGSVAFVVSTLTGGWLLELYGGAMVLPAMAFFFGVTTLVAIAAPRLGRPAPSTRPLEEAPVTHRSPFWQADFVLVIIGAAIVQGSHGLLFAFATNFWTAHGISGVQISFLWTAGVVAEIVLFFLSGRYLARYSNLSLVLFGCVVAVLRWSLFPLLDGFWSYLLLQASHAFTFAIIHVGIQRFLMERIGEDRGASAQGFYQFFISIFTVLATWASGFIYHAYGVKGFYIMALVAAVGVASVVAAMFVQPQRARSGG
ncbi:MAG: MFS transporter [Rhizobium sp.]|nr:MFS transporter [Rhizobium sp.]